MGAGAEVRLVNPCLLMCTGRGSSPSIASGGFFTCFLPTNRCVFKSLQSGLQQCLLPGSLKSIKLQEISINFSRMQPEDCQRPLEAFQRKNLSLGKIMTSEQSVFRSSLSAQGRNKRNNPSLDRREQAKEMLSMNKCHVLHASNPRCSKNFRFLISCYSCVVLFLSVQN